MHENTKRKIRVTDTSSFIARAREVHGDKYDYSLVDYKLSSKPVKITCPIHGSFSQKANNHLSGNGCRECSKAENAKRRRVNVDHFIARAREVHGDKYDYSHVNYKRLSDNIVIECPEHGKFTQTGDNHLGGSGCPHCAVSRRVKLASNDVAFFVSSARRVHGDKYDYTHVKYTKSIDKVEIVCPEHGSFWQTPHNHVSRTTGCPECAVERRKRFLTSNSENFIHRANLIHGVIYDYSLVQYQGNKTKVEIVCPEHGSFWQTPDGHNAGKGCAHCVSTTSKGENELASYIRSMADSDTSILIGDRNLIAPQEIDIVLPKYKLAIEFNGLYWHSEAGGRGRRYHLDKTEACEAKGYRLIHVYEDEWVNHKERVKEFFANLIGGTDNNYSAESENARDMQIVWNIRPEDYRKFCDRQHIQGHAANTENIALIDNLGAIKAVMGFTRMLTARKTILNRFCTHGRVRGAFSRLLTHYARAFPGEKIVSYADRRWSQGDVYIRNGFDFEGYSEPSFDYVKGIHRFNRRRFQKHKLPSLLGNNFDPEKTESQNMAMAGYYRLWNCGYMKFTYKNEKADFKESALRE